MMPTADFLKAMSFNTPPNAALIVQLPAGSDAVAVLELSDPSYEPTTRMLTNLT